MKYWQIACGSLGRYYADHFIRFGMAFVGGREHIATMAKVNVGDRVLMKRGTSKIIAAGEVVERTGKHRGQADKDWLRDFDGWDLQAYCYVDWHVPSTPVGVKGLTRHTIQNVGKQHLKDVTDEVISNNPVRKDIDAEPEPTCSVKDTEIIRYLINQGLRPGAAEDLTSTFNRIRLLANYYRGRRWEDIREHETRTFLVMPLLLALGWAEQQIKIELPVKNIGRADVACFSKPFHRSNEECVLIVETKGFSQGLDYTRKQAQGYAKQFPNCRVLLGSNGYCYKAWTRQDDGTFANKPSAYLNLLDPQDKYPLDPDNGKGCLEVLRLLLPSSWV